MKTKKEKRNLEFLYDILTELENLGCFEIETNERDRMRIAKKIVEVIEKGSEGEIYDKIDRYEV
uniref:Uncharacterized protein n=1 Tax=Archaeoglobus fulgidus TaxID=2234 RepID=A0A7C2NRP8_ARCFL